MKQNQLYFYNKSKKIKTKEKKMMKRLLLIYIKNIKEIFK